jgi:hypothetical protein
MKRRVAVAALIQLNPAASLPCHPMGTVAARVAFRWISIIFDQFCPDSGHKRSLFLIG